ncbi:hypothetical protein [Streptomyces sp. NPDC088725]|uniref:hypothetical protein n=1 Tax=Streptomyces sp. NPDC088725 TaxID=3365873 RepID=UPI0037F39D8F
MRPKRQLARPVREIRIPRTFAEPREIAIGAVVFDGDAEMPGTVRDIVGDYVDLERPTGRAWRARFRRLRPATDWERRQLAAVGALHRQQQKGLPDRSPRLVAPPARYGHSRWRVQGP